MNSSLLWLKTVLTDRRLRHALGLLFTLTLLGTLGYSVIEGMSVLDALYMTVITLSTVGYSEVEPLSDEGRWFTIGLIAFGVGAVFHAAGALAGFVIEGRLRELLGRKSMQRTIDRLEEHVVVCGFGRLGRAVANRLEAAKVVVVDLDESMQAAAEESGFLFVHGSALEEGVLRAAGIERAQALIAATGNDPDNVFISLSARELQPEIRIHASAESSAGVRRLKLSGASQVISPHELAGERIANALLRPGVVEFLELSDPGTGTEVDLEEVVLSGASSVDGIAIGDLHAHGLSLSVIAIKRGDEPIRMHPAPDIVLRGGDHVIAVGDRKNLTRLADAAQRE
jgi:voltage-gated potassium channel